MFDRARRFASKFCSTLKNLASSQSHLAMMDTFIARFQGRIAEMLCDVDARVVVGAARLRYRVARTHRAGRRAHEFRHRAHHG